MTSIALARTYFAKVGTSARHTEAELTDYFGILQACFGAQRVGNESFGR